jgi:uncharacterized metal-binding protein
MTENCCTGGGEVMILACSGGSNVGQLSNQAAVELTGEGFGKMFCLAGIGGKLSGFVRSAKDVPQMIVIDGCQVGCARAIMAQAGVALRGHLVLTELGIEKNKNLVPVRADIEQAKAAVRQVAGENRTVAPKTLSNGCGCGCECC